jgi:cell division septation protein DedD
MQTNSKVKRFIVIGAIAASSIAAVAPTLTSATGTGIDAATTTTAPATTTPTTMVKTTTTTIKIKAKTPTSTASVTKKYEVVAGIFTTKAKARAKIAALKQAKYPKFTIKNIGTKFAVVDASLTKTQATKLARQINAIATLGPAHIKRLA